MPHPAPVLRRLALAALAGTLIAWGCGNGTGSPTDGGVDVGGGVSGRAGSGAGGANAPGGAGGSSSSGGAGGVNSGGTGAGGKAAGSGGHAGNTGAGGGKPGGKPGGMTGATGGRVGTGGTATGGNGAGGKGGAPADKTCGTIAGITCGANAFCEFPAGMCSVPDGAGTCKSSPDVCPAIFAPVCGCDGKTYSSDCDRQGAAVSKASDGACGGAGGATMSTATYSGCHFVGGIDRLVIAKYDAQTNKCVTLVLADNSGIPAFTGLTITAPWYAESASLWSSTSADCARRDSPAGAAHATSGSGTVTVAASSSAISVDATMTFRGGDAGAPQTVDLQSQGVSTSAGCP